MRLIDGGKLEKRFVKYRLDCLNDGDVESANVFSDVISEIQDAPTIDPVKHGRWLNFYGNYSTAECSCCGSCFEVTFDEEANAALWAGFLESYKFCPNCGARMDANE